MTTPVFPAFPGVGWDILKTPTWSTMVQQSVSGRELRAAFFSQPRWKFELGFEVLRAFGAFTELKQAVALFGQMLGQFGTFFYDDPDDNTATAQTFGTGDGTTTVFQLKRTYSGASFSFTENLYAINGTPAPQIFKNAVLQGSGYTIDLETGLATFSVAPGAGVALTWTGKFYFRCRFLSDEQDFRNILSGRWQLAKLEFISVKA